MASAPSSTQTPKFQRAVTQDVKGRPQIADHVAVPPLQHGSILVKTVAVALNPSDYKMGAAFPTNNAIIGFDFAGIVACVGEGADAHFTPGDRVCGAVHGSNPAEPGNGAFAEYVRVPADLLLRIPDWLDWAKAATLGTGLATSLLAFWGPGALRLSATPDNPAEDLFPVLVYGGSTATGTLAIQLLKLSGFNPIATCSPHNFDLVRSYGASAVFNYAAADTAAAIRTHTGARLKYVLDCIADETSVACCYGAIQRAGGFYTALELVPEGTLRKRRAIKASFIMAPEVFGKEVKLSGGYERPASEEKHRVVVRMFAVVQRLLDEGKLRTHPVQMVGPGLEGILEGLELLRSGAVSGKKLVALVGRDVP
ncbi:putative zinc-binding dehydrogenase family oxidoreductase [Annulohypoxylon maeteangense]|uniref:putative zinc-binding dehydrogenase family oxidoreductase n=1 Tax=Annulohypoxylon maeteangense TaxID=1927788 RepID=UPI002008A739|nr:putative zinc-binding dehydrogenase family oxidoreductase [Annulohypoxylon maeteangense]KAI0890575.1 putative zinc-binding dehydrogenase family oxidoreductase [Annulohypoxylon maeteangense]